MEKKIKVLHIVNGLGFGGAETWLLEIVRRNRGEVQFDFLLTGGVTRELDDEFLSCGCKLHYVPFSVKRIFSFARAFNRIIREEKYTVIHDHEDFTAGWHFLLLLFQLPKVRISHAHNSMLFIDCYAKTTGRTLFYKGGKLLNALLATSITGTSHHLLNELGYDRRPYLRKRIEPLYCGARTESFRFDQSIRQSTREKWGFSENDKVVIFIGRIGLTREEDINHKNPEFAVAVARMLAESDRSFKFLFVGEKGKLGLSFESEMAALGLGQNIFFPGKRKDVNELLIAADLMLFTSTTEPFGLVLAEAQFSALPIVASDIITREVVIFPELFHLLDVGKGEKEEWTAAINNFFHSGFQRNTFATEHRDEITNSGFSIESSYQRLLRIYEGLPGPNLKITK